MATVHETTPQASFIDVYDQYVQDGYTNVLADLKNKL